MRQVNDRLAAEARSASGSASRDMRSIRAPFTEAVRLLRENIGSTRASRGSRAGARRAAPAHRAERGVKEIVDLYLSPADFPGSSSRATSSSRPSGKAQCVSATGRRSARQGGPLREAHRGGSYTVFIGDGISDRRPAASPTRSREAGPRPLLRAGEIRCHEFGRSNEVIPKLADGWSTADPRFMSPAPPADKRRRESAGGPRATGPERRQANRVGQPRRNPRRRRCHESRMAARFGRTDV